jgi:hypothetical protein
MQKLLGKKVILNIIKMTWKIFSQFNYAT